jgi:proteic killer suppression protein
LDILDTRFARSLMDAKERQKRYGVPMAKKIALRIAAIQAAASLDDFWPPYDLPERCHELTGDRAGTFSMDLQQAYRLLFVPADAVQAPHTGSSAQETSRLADPTRQRWKAIKTIEITAVEDTHD